jgi:hypothetical protein
MVVCVLLVPCLHQNALEVMSVFAHCSVPEIITTLAQTFDQLIAAQKCQDDMEYFVLLPLVPVLSKCCAPTLLAVWHTLT